MSAPSSYRFWAKATVIEAFEIAGEQTFLGHWVPAKNLNVGALFTVMVGHAVTVAVRQGGTGGMLMPPKVPTTPTLTCLPTSIRQETGLVGGIDLTDDIWNGRVMAKSTIEYFWSGSLWPMWPSRRPSKADRYMTCIALDQRVQVRLVVRLGL